jgi:hypothetical protein
VRSGSVLCLALCFTARADVSAPTPTVVRPIEADEYAIYKVVITSRLRPEQTAILIAPLTNAGQRGPVMTDQVCRGECSFSTGLAQPDDVVRDLEAKPVARIDVSKLKMKLVSLYERSESDPTRLSFVVSRVGFDPRHTKAAMLIDCNPGTRAGIGFLVRLEKKHGAWQITESLRTWIF